MSRACSSRPRTLASVRGSRYCWVSSGIGVPEEGLWSKRRRRSLRVFSHQLCVHNENQGQLLVDTVPDRQRIDRADPNPLLQMRKPIEWLTKRPRIAVQMLADSSECG